MIPQPRAASWGGGPCVIPQPKGEGAMCDTATQLGQLAGGVMFAGHVSPLHYSGGYLMACRLFTNSVSCNTPTCKCRYVCCGESIFHVYMQPSRCA